MHPRSTLFFALSTILSIQTLVSCSADSLNLIKSKNTFERNECSVDEYCADDEHSELSSSLGNSSDEESVCQLDSLKKDGSVYDDFEFGANPVGSGAQGSVYFVTCKQTNESLAIKVIEPKESWDYALVENEVHSLEMLKGKSHILQLYSVYAQTNPDKCFLVTESIVGPSLENFDTLVSGCKRINANFIPAIAMQLLKALTYLHQEGYVHNDVKPANVMLSTTCGVKLIDFGYCDGPHHEEDSSNPKQLFGTPLYMSPEKYSENDAGFPADVWAFGVSIFALYGPPFIFGNNPVSVEGFLEKLEADGCPWTMIPHGNSPWKSVPDEAREFLEQCFFQDPSLRPTVGELYESDFIQNSCTDEQLVDYINTLPL